MPRTARVVGGGGSLGSIVAGIKLSENGVKDKVDGTGRSFNYLGPAYVATCSAKAGKLRNHVG